MAVPKRKKSKSRRNSRRSHWKATRPTLTECPQCHEPKIPHRVCPHCGYYKDRQAVEVEE